MDILKLNDNSNFQYAVNRKIQTLILIPIAITAVFLTGCNTVYFKANESPPLKQTEANYTEIYQHEAPGLTTANFILNDHAIAISSIINDSFINLEKKQLIRAFKPSDYGYSYASSNIDGSQYLLFEDGFAKIINTQNITLTRQFGPGKPSNTSSLSNDGKLLYFDNSLWNVTTGEKIKSHIENISPSDNDFSDDNHYFIQAEINHYPTLVDIRTAEFLDTLPLILNSNKVSFRDNKSYYIDYGAKTYNYTESLGLFSIQPARQLAQITPSEYISCWTQLKDDSRLVMGLVNGDILVLDKQLNVLNHWSTGSKALKCEGGSNGKVWLASESSGLFEIDINKKTIANPVQWDDSISSLTVSSDGKYIALVNSANGKSRVSIYLNLNE